MRSAYPVSQGRGMLSRARLLAHSATLCMGECAQVHKQVTMLSARWHCQDTPVILQVIPENLCELQWIPSISYYFLITPHSSYEFLLISNNS